MNFLKGLFCWPQLSGNYLGRVLAAVRSEENYRMRPTVLTRMPASIPKSGDFAQDATHVATQSTKGHT